MDTLVVVRNRLVTTSCCWQQGDKQQLALEAVDKNLLMSNLRENAVNDIIYLREK